MSKLIDLKPHWIGLENWKSPSKFYVGVSFLCPHCAPKMCPTCGHLPDHKRLAVYFWPPIDPDGLLGSMFNLPHNGGHVRTGDTFETLTLSPSIGFDSIGHWHGNITNGDCQP